MGSEDEGLGGHSIAFIFENFFFFTFVNIFRNFIIFEKVFNNIFFNVCITDFVKCGIMWLDGLLTKDVYPHAKLLVIIPAASHFLGCHFINLVNKEFYGITPSGW